MVQVALVRRICVEQCLNHARLLDMDGELSRVVALSCARNFTFGIILIVSMARLTKSLHAFIPLSLCSLSVLCLLSLCLFPALIAMPHCQVIEQPSCTNLRHESA